MNLLTQTGINFQIEVVPESEDLKMHKVPTCLCPQILQGDSTFSMGCSGPVVTKVGHARTAASVAHSVVKLFT